MLDWARAQRIGFSHFVSLGEHADVDFGDMLDYLASDAHTRAILLYIESVEHAQVHVGRAGGGTQQAGHRHQGRAQRAGAEGRGLAHRRAGGADAVYDAPSPAPACCA
jgi:acetyltransferase